MDGMTEPVAPRRRRRPYVVLALLLILGIGLGLAWRYRVQVAEQAANVALDALGLGNDISFRVTDIELVRIRLEDLRYGDGGPTALAAEIIFASDAQADAVVKVFPKLPNIGRLEVIGGHLRAERPNLQANGSFAATVARGADGRLESTVILAAADNRGRELTLEISGLATTIQKDQISLDGPAQLLVDDAANATRAALDVWLNGTLTPEGIAAGEVIVVTGNGQLGKRLSVKDVRGA
jgi:hypothetical protein